MDPGSMSLEERRRWHDAKVADMTADQILRAIDEGGGMSPFHGELHSLVWALATKDPYLALPFAEAIFKMTQMYDRDEPVPQWHWDYGQGRAAGDGASAQSFRLRAYDRARADMMSLQRQAADRRLALAVELRTAALLEEKQKTLGLLLGSSDPGWVAHPAESGAEEVRGAIGILLGESWESIAFQPAPSADQDGPKAE